MGNQYVKVLVSAAMRKQRTLGQGANERGRGYWRDLYEAAKAESITLVARPTEVTALGNLAGLEVRPLNSQEIVDNALKSGAMKQCVSLHCCSPHGAIMPASEAYFYRDRKYLMSVCKWCHRQKINTYRIKRAA